MKLYEITGAMAEVQQMIEDGVPLEHLEDTLNEIKVDFHNGTPLLTHQDVL